MRRFTSPKLTTTLSLRCACQSVVSPAGTVTSQIRTYSFSNLGWWRGSPLISTGFCGEFDWDNDAIGISTNVIRRGDSRKHFILSLISFCRYMLEGGRPVVSEPRAVATGSFRLL